jgi:hypothetical protein
MEEYTYFEIDKVWDSSCLSNPLVKEAIEFVGKIYEVTKPGPWTTVGVKDVNDPTVVHGPTTIVSTLQASTPMHLTYYLILNDSRFTVLLLLRILQVIFPMKVFLIAEGRLPRSTRKRYFCVELITTGQRITIAYDYTYYLTSKYESLLKGTNGNARENVREYETVQFFEEVEFIKHIAWVACGVELYKLYPQIAVIEDQDLDNSVICLKNQCQRCYPILYNYWVATRSRLAAARAASSVPSASSASSSSSAPSAPSAKPSPPPAATKVPSVIQPPSAQATDQASGPATAESIAKADDSFDAEKWKVHMTPSQSSASPSVVQKPINPPPIERSALETKELQNELPKEISEGVLSDEVSREVLGRTSGEALGNVAKKEEASGQEDKEKPHSEVHQIIINLPSSLAAK